jgi:hypothetical protein
MTTSIAVLLSALVFLATVASAQIIAPTRQDAGIRGQPAVEQFMTAVNKYIELHRVLGNPLADLTHGADPGQTARAQRAHRSLIREAGAISADILHFPREFSSLWQGHS